MKNIRHFDIEPANLWKSRNTRVVRIAQNNGENIDLERRKQKSHQGRRVITSSSQNKPHNGLIFNGML